MQGILRCAKYGFSPNKLKYCGPDKNREVLAYITTQKEDQGLVEILDDFQVMYPYLKLIADENDISDPFDERVVEAYWIGNELLEKVSLKGFWEGLLEGQNLKRRFKKKDLKWMMGKVPVGAKVHHSFHVFNIWNRTGHEAKPHTVETMDKCRISAGEIMGVLKDKVMIKTDKLEYKEGKLRFKEGVKKRVSWKVGESKLAGDLKKGDLVTVHWDYICEKINKKQAENLKKYNKHHLRLANLTV